VKELKLTTLQTSQLKTTKLDVKKAEPKDIKKTFESSKLETETINKTIKKRCTCRNRG